MNVVKNLPPSLRGLFLFYNSGFSLNFFSPATALVSGCAQRIFVGGGLRALGAPDENVRQITGGAQALDENMLGFNEAERTARRALMALYGVQEAPGTSADGGL